MNCRVACQDRICADCVFPMPLSTAILKTQGGKNCNSRSGYDEGQLILDSKRTRSAISFRPLPFAFLDGERLPLTGHLRDKATRGVEGFACHAALDIPISWYRECFSSRHPRLLSGIYTLFMEFIIRSQPALYVLPAPSSFATWKTLGDHLTEDSAVSMPRWWLFFHETF